jgi:flagellar M-ring protein FliF
MAITSNQYRDQFNTYFSHLSLKQKILLLGGIASIITIILLLFIWTARPNYEILFSNLSAKDAGKIVEKLREQKIPYELENGGNTILVPSEKVYDLRLEFAQEGLPETSSVGYEIFDRTNLGMTDFIQQVNYRRALEGELAKTIEQIDAIEKARVHIVLPKEALFKEDQQQTTASVILKLRGLGTPSPSIIQGISHLVASSVEGLDPENVTILDTRGKVLLQNRDPDDLLTLSVSQLEFTTKAENYLAQKTQSMLNQVVGPGNAVVRVTAELNFQQVEKDIEEYDPDNSVVVSEEIQEESTPVNGDGSNTNGSVESKRNVTTTNYEINKTVQHIVEGIGNIKRLSVAVMINNKGGIITGSDGKKQMIYNPRPQTEMNMLTDLTKTAVGFQQERGDQISVINVDFSVPSLEDELFNADRPMIWDNWSNLLEKIFLFLVIFASILIMRSLFSQVHLKNENIHRQIQALSKAGARTQLPVINDNLPQLNAAEEESEEDIVMVEDFFKSINKKDPLNKNIENYIKEKPEDTAKALKVWLTDDEN